MPDNHQIKQFLQFLTVEKRYSAHTVVSYQNDLTDLMDFLECEFAANDLKDVTHSMLRSWMASLKERKFSARTINRKLSAAKSLFKYLLRLKAINVNPAQLIPSLKQSKRLPTFVERSGIELLFDRKNFDDGFEGDTAYLIFALLYTTGMRLSELIHLKEKDIDKSNALIKVLGKGNKQRFIPLKPAIAELIENYILKKRQKSAFETSSLMITPKGKSLYPVYVQRLVRRYLNKVTTISKKSPHVLRHTFATHLSNNGASINAIKELLGHASLAATQVYTHTGIDHLKEVYKQAHPKS